MGKQEDVAEILRRRDEAVEILTSKAKFGADKLSLMDRRVTLNEAEVDKLTARTTVPKKVLTPLETLKGQRQDLSDAIDLLNQQAVAVDMKAANDVWDAQETQDALGKMQNIVKRMNQVAARMVTTTQFISNANVLATTAKGIGDFLVDK